MFIKLVSSAVRLWLVFPTFVVLQLGKDLVDSLNFAAEVTSKSNLKKTK